METKARKEELEPSLQRSAHVPLDELTGRIKSFVDLLLRNQVTL
jgi:hypothetical protein